MSNLIAGMMPIGADVVGIGHRSMERMDLVGMMPSVGSVERRCLRHDTHGADAVGMMPSVGSVESRCLTPLGQVSAFKVLANLQINLHESDLL